MLLELEPPRFGNIVLAAFNLGIHELLDAAAVEADQVVVVLARVKLINRLSRLEVTAQQQTGLLELHEHAVDGCETDVGPFLEQNPVDIFRAQVALLSILEGLQYFQARPRGFEARVL